MLKQKKNARIVDIIFNRVGGDIGAGTKMLREIVMRQREKFARKLKKLPKPK